jgi:hypothetical protein
MIKIGRRVNVRRLMIMDEIDDRRWDNQSSQGRPSRRDEVSRDPFQWIHYNQIII